MRRARDAFALGLQPDLVIVAAVPGVGFPAVARAFIRVLPLQPVEHHFSEAPSIVHAHHLDHLGVAHVVHVGLRRIGRHVFALALALRPRQRRTG